MKNVLCKTGKMGINIAKAIPFAGTAIAVIEEIISLVWEPYKEMR